MGFMNNFAKKYMGKHWKSFAPYFGTIGLYLGVANMIGMFGITPPTKDLNVTAGLALMSCGLIYGSSFRYKGLKGGLHKFSGAQPYAAAHQRDGDHHPALSLCMRLFGNVLGAFIIMELLKLAIPAILPMAMSLYFDVFDGIIQAVVFVFLTAMFHPGNHGVTNFPFGMDGVSPLFIEKLERTYFKGVDLVCLSH